jgi:hypothetical protein
MHSAQNFLKRKNIAGTWTNSPDRTYRKFKIKGTFHYDEGFYYFRNLGNRILLGGGRNQDFKTEETTALKQQNFCNHLENFLKEVILPNQELKLPSLVRNYGNGK